MSANIGDAPGRNSKLWLIGGLVTVIAATAWAIWPARGSSEIAGTALTHRVTRGDLQVIVREQGTLESGENTEIKCKVRGQNTVISVVEGGTEVKKGDVLVRLDTLFIEEQINERSKYALWSRSASERSKADVARAELAVSEYLGGEDENGRFQSQLMTLEKDLAISESNLRTAQNMLDHAAVMAERGYVSKLDVEQKEFNVTQAKLEVEVKKTNIDVLQKFTRKEELETLRGTLAADRARHEADVERAFADAQRRDRALEELGYCVIKAPRDGLVIYPSAAKWKTAPDIEEGASVHKDQILLLMPDLSQMQVKVGVHESIIDRVHKGLPARVVLTDRKIDGEVSSVATVTQPAGWWTGNVVKYDTIVALPNVGNLKPGMSAEVQIIIATHRDVLKIPVAAVTETDGSYFCWVKTTDGPEKRQITLGDSNDVFIVVEEGISEGDDVFLNPLAFIEEAQEDVLQPIASGASDEAPADAKDSTAKDSTAEESATADPTDVDSNPPSTPDSDTAAP